MPSDFSYSKIHRGLLNYERNTGQRHPLSLGIRDFKRAVVYNPLTELQTMSWSGPVSVGTPPVEFTVYFDTGSSDFIIPGMKCTGCDSHIRYKPSASSTSYHLRKKFDIAYRTGVRITGSLVTDTV